MYGKLRKHAADIWGERKACANGFYKITTPKKLQEEAGANNYTTNIRCLKKAKIIVDAAGKGVTSSAF